MVKLPLPFFKKKAEKHEEKPEEEEDIDKLLKKSLKEETPVALGELPKLRTPKILFVGSSKGGSGKSFISSNLIVVASALSVNKHVFAVDMDLDNYTISEVLPPPGVWALLEARIQKTGVRYLTVSDIIHEGNIDTSKLIPRFKAKTLSCGGAQIEYEFRLIPAYDYNILRRREQMMMLRNIDSRLLRKGVEVLLEYFRSRINKGEDIFVVFDGKQKSSVGIEYEPMYRLMIEEADTFLLVTEPPYLNFNELTVPYKRAMEKMIIVVNKADRPSLEQITLLATDALSKNVPVFVIPYLEDESKLYSSTERRAPAAIRLNTKSGIYTMTLAYLLGLLNDELIKNTGCDEEMMRVLSLSKHLCRASG